MKYLDDILIIILLISLILCILSCFLGLFLAGKAQSNYEQIFKNQQEIIRLLQPDIAIDSTIQYSETGIKVIKPRVIK